MHVRQTRTGTFELTIKNRLLPKRYSRTFASEKEARAHGAKIERSLAAGVVPVGLGRDESDQRLGDRLPLVIADYLDAVKLAASDRPMVEWLQEHVLIDTGQLTARWVDEWVLQMKQAHLAPGTIRKKVESLARVVDWHYRRKYDGQQAPQNPLRTLPRGYSSYGEGEAPEGKEGRVDVHRDRRLGPGEYEAIDAVVGQRSAELQVMWRLIVNTALRLREAYRLRPSDVRFELRTIHVPPGKTGKARDVPMTREVEQLLREHMKTLPEKAHRLFSFWDGTAEDLDRCTARLSTRFSSVFAAAGAKDLTEHDLRHEGTCRWMLMRDREGRWLFRPEEVRRITGHRNVQQFERYLSLRGSDLAERLT